VTVYSIFAPACAVSLFFRQSTFRPALVAIEKIADERG
jgi:hypothetical protein